MVDWVTGTDLLRCNPKFWNRPRYDFAIVDFLSRGQVFVQLVFLFMCQVGASVYSLALVQALERHPRRGAIKDIDKKLSIYRWNIRARSRCEIIPLCSIVRGALLIPDNKYVGDYFVVDTLDANMFLRVKAMYQ